MDGYKKIIKNKNLRLKLIRCLNWIPDKTMLKFQYRVKLGRKLNLRNPKRWTEKAQWYKLYYHDPLMTKCADKYTVREYVQQKGLGAILNELYGVYDSPLEIDFDSLPEKFVIKVTSGCGTNIIVKNKKEFNKEDAIQKLAQWQKNGKQKSVGREWPYYNIKPRIIIEKYLEETETGLIDYKFFCFNGKANHLLVISDRFTEEKLDLYDTEWNRMNVIQSDCPNQTPYNLPKPENFKEMVKMAEVLSKDFPHTRVDFYNINGKIYFGELTFFSGSGYYIFTPDEFDFIMGEKFVLPEKNV